jgi:hypothetical protein
MTGFSRWVLGLALVGALGCHDATGPNKSKPVAVDPEFAKMMEHGGAGGGGACSKPQASAECRYKFLTAVDNFRLALQGGRSWEQFADSYRDYVNTPDPAGYTGGGERQCAPLCWGPLDPAYRDDAEKWPGEQ